MPRPMTTPTSLKIILAYLAVVFALRLVEMLLGGFSYLGAGFCLGVAAIGAGLYWRNKATYYVFTVLLTVAIYATVVYVVIVAANSHGRALTDWRFLIGVALTLIPIIIISRLAGEDEVKAQYTGQHGAPDGEDNPSA